jgi:long-chain acyl-CoA synthetase
MYNHCDFFANLQPVLIINTMLNLSGLLEESAFAFPNQVAFQYEETKLTYAQTNALANQVANGLVALGIQKNDKVVLDCVNVPYFPVIYYGILKTGAVVVPINVMLKTEEIAYHLQDSDAKAIFCFTGTPELPMVKFAHEAQQKTPTCKHFIEITPLPTDKPTFEGTISLGMLLHGKSPVFETVHTNPEDTAIILYTSGTTGKPKGAELSHLNMYSNSWKAADIFNYTENDVNLITLPLFHSFAQTVQLNGAVKRGARNILVPKFMPRLVIQKMAQEKVTIFCGVPTMYWALTQAAKEAPELAEEAAKSLRISVSGGAALAVEDLKNFEDIFKTTILEGYGLSEASPVVCFNRPLRKRKIGSIGQTVPALQAKVVDKEGKEVPVGEIGELIARGVNIMKGYYKKPEETAKAIKNGWLYTGDLAKMDEEGYFYIVDRTKDMIVKGGYNVYPREVEEILLQHADILQVAVIGVPDSAQGEEVKAFVVLKEGSTVSERDVIKWARENMATYKAPRDVEFRKELPMNATGKILKTELRKS